MECASSQPQVLHRHRRQPPALMMGILMAIILLIAITATTSAWWSAAFVLLAIVALALGWLGRRRLWIEDHVITETHVALMRPDGLAVEIPLDRLIAVRRKGNAVRFTRDDGALLDFNRNPHSKAILQTISQIAPSAQCTTETIDLACDT